MLKNKKRIGVKEIVAEPVTTGSDLDYTKLSGDQVALEYAQTNILKNKLVKKLESLKGQMQDFLKTGEKDAKGSYIQKLFDPVTQMYYGCTYQLKEKKEWDADAIVLLLQKKNIIPSDYVTSVEVVEHTINEAGLVNLVADGIVTSEELLACAEITASYAVLVKEENK